MGDKIDSKLRPGPSIFKILELHAKENRLTLKDLRFLLTQEERTKELLEQKKEEQEKVTQVNIRNNTSILEENVEKVSKRFTVVMNKLNKAAREKLPNKIENPSVYIGLDEISELEKTSSYITTCNYIKIVADKIDTSLREGSDLEAINFLIQLQLVQNLHLNGTECGNLWDYCSKTTTHWEKQLELKFTSGFEKLLEKMDWPMKLDILDDDKELSEKFQKSIRCLVRVNKLCFANNESKQPKKSPLLIDFHEPILPIKIMVRPLKKRFRFHFFSSKATQNDLKPEWYFAQVKKWCREIIPFIKAHMEDVTVGEVNKSSVVDFVRSLSELLILKSDSQLSNSNDKISDVVFAKILEESILFENEVGRFIEDQVDDKQVYIPPFVSTLFSQPHVLQRWLSIEKKACFEKLDEIFASPSAWDRAVAPGPPEIVDLFIAMLRFVTDRFAHLQQPGQRIQFLRLLLEILDDFRVRCLQWWKSMTTEDCYRSDDVLIDYIIADSFLHIVQTLERWEDLHFFSSLSFFIRNLQDANENEAKSLGLETLENYDLFDSLPSQSDSAPFSLFAEVSQKESLVGGPGEGLFTNVQKMYQYSGEEILSKWCKHFVNNVRESIATTYAKRKWHSFPEETSKDGPIISQEFLGPFQRITTVSKAIVAAMNSLLAEKWLKRLAVHLDEMIMDVVIMPNKFSKGAMQQINYDLTHGLFSVFAECDISTSIFLSGLSSVFQIWEMPLGEAMLTFETLANSSMSFESQEETIAEMGLSLRPSDVIKVLRGRTDIAL